MNMNPPNESPANTYDGRHDSHVHLWFQLSYAHYLVLPRSLMESMPIEWQARMVACLEEMREATSPLTLNDDYMVKLRDNGRFVSDPWSPYRHCALRLPLEGQ